MQLKINSNIDNALEVYIIDNNFDVEKIKPSLKKVLEEINYFESDNFKIFYYINESEKIYLVNLGDTKKLLLNDIRHLGFKIAKDLKSKNYSNININYFEVEYFESNIFIPALIEGFLQSNYSFDTYKTKKDTKLDFNINIKLPNNAELNERFLSEVENIVDGINITRELVNTPSIDLYPETLAQKAKEILEPLGIKVTVYNKKEIEDMNMHAFLAVSKGSAKEPKFIKLEYTPVKDKNSELIALVGKGLTYDSGGYAIKKPEGMATMMGDMAGSATVIGTMYALAKNNIQQNVVGLIAACENMISGNAYKNGDIISSMKGTTIEVKNTDAEGRLTLADALYYAATKTEANTIVDLATLTGACVVALGEITTGIVTNNDNVYNKIQEASEKSGEYVWKLPSFKETRDMLKSKIADITNSTGPYGGAITAGLFLEEFVEGKNWAHMDIAGPAYITKPYSYIPYGATGIPVKTLYNFVKDF
ncbi:leucyl aminopeptidase [Miniphocaeibacter halophilus]|uniref:Leucyl aminopeptidase n=1 Tax=Miniphocaeibacter halophilus TaxID=2931922 RepID=A0AC61MR10_9FIRM|nr:leucyl aminopeptidase [Miniphocaeibacter halophilus]QQK07922.1 leucyl aminopeptidase [Miniphocaeibacter halophilus]